MAFKNNIRDIYQSSLKAIEEAGIFKEERYIHSSQAADVDVEFPIGSSTKNVINMCSNNYLGLSSHPEVIKAAHAGLDSRVMECLL
jgi:glycine C-acetyltransferase